MLQSPLTANLRSPSPRTEYNRHLNPADLSSYGGRPGYSPSERHERGSNYDNNSRRGSPVRSRLYLDPVEREELEKHSRQEYVDAINELEHTPGITQEDIQDFKQSAIIAKSVEVVKLQAEYQKQIRQKAGNNYRDVKSKVARCIKVRNKVTKKNQRDKNEARLQLIIFQLKINNIFTIIIKIWKINDKSKTRL